MAQAREEQPMVVAVHVNDTTAVILTGVLSKLCTTVFWKLSAKYILGGTFTDSVTDNTECGVKEG